MTRWRTRPATRDRKMPAPTDNAPDPRRAAPEARAGCRASAVGSVNVVVGRVDAERAARFFHQIGLDEDIDIAVEHAVHVADLLLGAMILHQLIRMQHVA